MRFGGFGAFFYCILIEPTASSNLVPDCFCLTFCSFLGDSEMREKGPDRFVLAGSADRLGYDADLKDGIFVSRESLHPAGD